MMGFKLRIFAWIGVAVFGLVVTGGKANAAETGTKSAVFAGGCFWCMQSEFDSEPGVVKVVVGYTGGSKDTATYEQVSTGTTGHYEAMEVFYDPQKVSYSQLLSIFWSNVDPTDAKGQFVDKGPQYRAAIFAGDAVEKQAAEASKAEVARRLNAAVVTEILPRQPFYAAEVYHQDYAKKNPIKYGLYESGNGRKETLETLRQRAGGKVFEAEKPVTR